MLKNKFQKTNLSRILLLLALLIPIGTLIVNGILNFNVWINWLTNIKQSEISEIEYLPIEKAAFADQNIIQNIEMVPVLQSTSGEIRKIVASTGKLYLLEGDRTISSYSITRQNYNYDQSFLCQPLSESTLGDNNSNKIIDISSVEASTNYSTSHNIIGISNRGDIFLCGSNGMDMFQLIEPQVGWGNPTGIFIDYNDIYIADEDSNAIWNYSTFAFNSPSLIFDEMVPDISNNLGIVFNQDSLYIAKLDQEIITCQKGYSTGYFSDCETKFFQYNIIDSNDLEKVLANIDYSHITYSRYSSSIFLLEPSTKLIYSFSPGFELMRIFKPITKMPESVPSSIAISPDLTFYIAIQNQLYAGKIP